MKKESMSLRHRLLAMLTALTVMLSMSVPAFADTVPAEDPSDAENIEVTQDEENSEEVNAGADADIEDDEEEATEDPVVEEPSAEPMTELPAAENGVITLTSDVDLADIAIIKDVTTIDLNGFTINGTSDGRALAAQKNLTIKDSSADKSGGISVSGIESKAVIVDGGAVIDMQGGNLKAEGQECAGIYIQWGNAVMSGGSIEAEGVGASGVCFTDYENSFVIKDDARIEVSGQGCAGINTLGFSNSVSVSGGSIAVNGADSYGIQAVEQGQDGHTITIKDGKITASGGSRTYAVYLEMDNTFSMSGGTIESTEGPALVYFQSPNVGTITGGTITGKNYGIYILNAANNTLEISGDTVVSGETGSINAGGNRYKSTPAVTISGGYFNGGVDGGVPSDKTDNYAKYDITGGYFTDAMDSALYNYSYAKTYTPETYTDEIRASETVGLLDVEEVKDDVTYNYTVASKYVLMNIPYDKFYAAELTADSPAVDAVTSATKSKPRTGTLAGGSYHVSSEGTDISGVIYPVFVEDMSVLKGKTRITDDSSVDITVKNRGKESTTTYEGKDALFESDNYSFYILNETPSLYKKMDGEMNFSAVNAEAKEVTGATGEVTAGAKHADIEITLSGTEGIAQGAAVSGVILTDDEGNKYGLRHIANIWRGTELGWNTDELALSGKTIKNIRYITQSAVIDYPVDIEIPSDEVVDSVKADAAADKASKAADKAAEELDAAEAAAENASGTPEEKLEAANNYKAAADAMVEAANAAKEASDVAVEAAVKAYGEDSAEAKVAKANQTAAAATVKYAAAVAKDAAKTVQAAEAEKKAADDAKAAAEAAKAKADAAAAVEAAQLKANNGVVDPSLPKVSIKNPKKAKKSFTAKWKKLSKKKIKAVKGIEVEYSLTPDFSNPVFKTVGAKKTSVKIKKLASKKTYYVRAHTYVVRGGTKYVSNWSATKKIKVK